jgi:hypothetical protein
MVYTVIKLYDNFDFPKQSAFHNHISLSGENMSSPFITSCTLFVKI